MTPRMPLISLLALAVACGGPTAETPVEAPEPAPTSEILALSHEAVESAPEPADTGGLDASLADELVAASELQPGSLDEEEPAAEPEPDWGPTAAFSLRYGETLAHFARWAELPVETVAEVSELDLDGSYPVGTQVVLPVSGEALSALEARREAHHQTRVESYLAARGGSLGSEFYAVRTGDSAWSIAKERYGVPLWVLAAYNPAVDLDTLRPGQELLMPVVADTVVDAEPDEPEALEAPLPAAEAPAVFELLPDVETPASEESLPEE